MDNKHNIIETKELPINVADVLQAIALNIESAQSLFEIVDEELFSKVFPANDKERYYYIDYAYKYCVPIYRIIGDLLYKCSEDLATLGFTGDE